MIAIAIFWSGCTAAAQQTGAKAYGNPGINGDELSIVAAKVQMLLTAPSGKKTGFEPKSQKVTKEIPGSVYYQDALLEYDSGRVDPNTTQTIDVKRATPGKYRLTVSQGNAADGEGYEIQVHLYLHGGGDVRTTRIAGTAEHGKIATYEVTVSRDSATVAVIDQQKHR